LPYGGGGTGQAFQNASIYNSTQTGTHAVTGAIRLHYFALAGAAGALGYPTGDAVCGATGCSQSFQGGVLRTNAAGGLVR
jgi:uncharacterized protein with LGFP repeats